MATALVNVGAIDSRRFGPHPTALLGPIGRFPIQFTAKTLRGDRLGETRSPRGTSDADSVSCRRQSLRERNSPGR